jgi:hypothetical protein
MRSANLLVKRWEGGLIRFKFQCPLHQKIQRFDGEVWVEDNKKWIMQNGAKVSFSNLQEARMPIWCPRCSKPMNHRFDRKFYYLRGWCFNCNVDVEHQMRLDGTFEEFEKRIVRENEKAWLRDAITERLEYVKNFKEPQMHFSDGRWEKLAERGQFKELFDSIFDDVDKLVERLDIIISQELSEYENT